MMGVPKVVKAFRSLRQRGPLSPFLFTIVADVFRRIVVRDEDHGWLESFLVSKDRISMSLILFVDDTIFFSLKLNLRSCKTLSLS